MSAGAPTNDHVAPMESFEKGMGQTPLFDIKEMGLLPNALKGMFATAEQSVAQLFGGKDTMLPFAGGSAGGDQRT